MRHSKAAVFQVNDCEGVARLVCVRGATFAEGARLEMVLRKSLGTFCHVTFLGRFDEIETVSDVAEFLRSYLPASRRIPTPDTGAKRLSLPARFVSVSDRTSSRL
jgi:hypothetical protein